MTIHSWTPRTQSKSMLSDFLRSGLFKDEHDLNQSVGMLSDLLRSGLPNDKLHHNTAKWNPKVRWVTFWEAGYLRIITTEQVSGYIERPIEKRATEWQFTPEHHKHSPKVCWATFWEAGYLRTNTTEISLRACWATYWEAGCPKINYTTILPTNTIRKYAEWPLRSGLLKDKHNRTGQRVCWATYWEAGYPMKIHSWTPQTVRKYAERPFEKRATKGRTRPKSVSGHAERPIEKRAAQW